MTVWLGCEQRDRIFGNYWLLIVFVQLNTMQKKQAPEGLLVIQTIIYMLTGERLQHVLMDRSLP
ncbi:hypothetical protein CEJ32_21830 [Enterobacter sp. 9-2]|nr:hypothetical protein CEJ32_21830 [Enterobacter sp. 9-2]